ncbi:MAG: hypothetical protein S4CHLAM81_05570 [Chlamydiales bacterium]|nr:hypothetical protein [Chlamydiales bacterium]MCH9635342.1 hypothetical protein [Chlamydiales bacterium]MCH9703324.1 hypothetical protein [Chlamydiota bacterium]
MLRFIRIGRGYLLHLPKKERRVSTHLIKGVLLAVGFHLLFALVFHVVSPKASDEHLLLRPSTVEVDLGRRQLAKLAPAPIKNDKVPSLSDVTPGAICSIETYCDYNCSAPDFSEIERLDYKPLEVNFD